MASSNSKGRGWHGDSAGHARAGRLGGQVSGGNFKNRSSEDARRAAKKSSGNFALNRERAVAAGRIGGSRSSASSTTPVQTMQAQAQAA